jgi:hypothetical protein
MNSFREIVLVNRYGLWLLFVAVNYGRDFAILAELCGTFFTPFLSCLGL